MDEIQRIAAQQALQAFARAAGEKMKVVEAVFRIAFSDPSNAKEKG